MQKHVTHTEPSTDRPEGHTLATIVCPYCQGAHHSKHGYRYSEASGKKISRRYRCKSCDKLFSIPLNTSVETNRFPQILLLDIETAPLEVYVWALHKQFITPKQIIKDGFVISWAAKWLYDDTIFSSIVTPKEAVERNDRRIMKELWTMLDEADMIIGHNVLYFDERKVNSRFLYHEFDPPSPYRVVDTLKAQKRISSEPSYKQAYLTYKYQLEEKIDTQAQGGLDLWKRCVNGDKDALKAMLEYNIQDIRGLEGLYLKLRPYIKNHPNLGVIMDEAVCSHCGSDHLSNTEQYYYTSAFRYRVLRCENCGTPYIREKCNSSEEKTDLRSVAS